jgi:MoxR-like ATPase
MVTPPLRAARTGPDDAHARIDSLIDALCGVIVGKRHQITLAATCLLARGHLLIEDVPGVGKTTLAHALAAALGLSFQRIQFTSDLLPADVTGVSVFDRNSGGFRFHKGPVFSQLVLADEINRATPKAQSALLEAMEERQVTADGETFRLPEPFFVVATRNPLRQIGTFPLPESQLDRFLMQISLGYPDPAEERELLRDRDRREILADLQPALSVEAVLRLQALVSTINVSDALLDYVQALIAHTRESGDFLTGLSPRGGIALLRAARAWALVAGHGGVHPEDVQAVFPAVAAHRLEPADTSRFNSADDAAASILESVAIP